MSFPTQRATFSSPLVPSTVNVGVEKGSVLPITVGKVTSMNINVGVDGLVTGVMLKVLLVVLPQRVGIVAGKNNGGKAKVDGNLLPLFSGG